MLIQLEGGGAQVEVLLADSGDDVSPVGMQDVVRETVRVAADDDFASVTGLARQFLAALPSAPGGFGAEVAAFVAEELFMELDAPVVRVAGDDCHLAYDGPEENATIPDPKAVLVAARRLVAF